MSLTNFVLRYLPPPARVLEIGCGPVGDLTYAIAAAGYDIVAVDPVAPEGPLFRRIPFEDFTEPGPFDAVVASLSMHHLADLRRTAAAIASLLRPGGRFILQEWDRDRLLDDATARWYFHQRQAAAVTGLPTGDAPLADRYTRSGAVPGSPIMAICTATRRYATSLWRRSGNGSSPGDRTSTDTVCMKASNR